MNLVSLILTLSIEVSQWVHHPHFGGFNSILTEGDQLMAATAGGILFCTVSPDGIGFDSTWTYQGRLGWDRVSSLYRHGDGSLWVTYLGGGIEVFHGSGAVTRYGQLEGLPLNLMVNQVYPDTAIYAATTQGLSIKSLGFFVTYNESGTGGGLPSSVVNCIAPVDSGLLVGTYAGLTLLLPGMPPSEASSWRGIDSLTGRPINAIEERGDSLWVIAGDKVFVCPPGGSWTQMSSYPGSWPASLAGTANGVVVGDQNALYTYSGGEWSSVENAFHGSLLTAVSEVAGVGVVAGMTNPISADRLEGPGMALITGSTVRRYTPPGCTSNDLYSIGVNSQGVCWVGAFRSGVGYHHGGSWNRVKGVLPQDNQIFALDVRGNTVYAASYHHGVTWIDWNGQEVLGGTTFTVSDGLLNDQITAVSVWNDQVAWFAHEPYWATPDEASGVSRISWQPGSPEAAVITGITGTGSFTGKFVRDVAAVSASTAWIATNTGLAEVSVPGGVSRVYRTADGLPSDDVLSLAVARSGDVFAGTATGLARLRDGTLQTIEGISGSVGSLCADHRGGVWAAVPGTLYRVGPDGEVQTFNRYNTPLPEVTVRAMACERETGRLWLATSHGAWVAELGTGLGPAAGGAVVYPNPFRPGAGEVLGVAGISEEPAVFSIFDMTGVLLFRYSSEGRDDFAWDGTASDGSPAASGVYVLMLEKPGAVEMLKFAIVR